MEIKKIQVLNSTHLKLIALITMIIDHIGAVLFPQIKVLRMIGRLAFPIYAYLIGEGCIYSKNKPKYLIKVGITYIVYEIVSYLVRGDEHNICVLYGFICAILSVIIIEWAKEKPLLRRPIAVIPIMAMIISTLIIKSDYIFFAILLPLSVYFIKKVPIRYLCFAILLILCGLSYEGNQWMGIFAMIPILLYNGQKGKEVLFKNSFYIMYPLHFAILGIIKMFL